MGNKVKHLAVGGVTYDLGDIFTADFAEVADPVASIKSCQDTLKQILAILRGDTGDSDSSSE